VLFFVGAAVDAGFDAPLGVGDEGGLLGDGAGVEEDAAAALLEAAAEDFVEGVEVGGGEGLVSEGSV
jgi:hypothetical protein